MKTIINTVILSGSRICVAFPHLGEDVAIDKVALRAFIEKNIKPIIDQGVKEGYILLENVPVASVNLEDGSFSEWGDLGIPTKWIAHLPWWHPHNDDWASSPFCENTMMAV